MLLEQLEPAEQPEPALVFLAAREVELDQDELRGALRRAVLLLATDGDPRRELDLDGRAVRAVARDLETPERRRDLTAALGRLAAEAEGLPGVEAALVGLVGDEDSAWRWLAGALLADELGDDDD